MPHIRGPLLIIASSLALGCGSAGSVRAPAQNLKSVAGTTASPAEHSWKPSLRATDAMTETFEHHGNWIGQSLQFAPFDKLRLELEKNLGRHLQNRGEAQITLITPPEFEGLKSCFSIEEIENLLNRKTIQDASFVPDCIGKGSLGAPPFKQETFFVVVKSPGLLALRKKLEVAAAAKGCGDFKAARYFPHVTLGFDQRDLHEADGVRKDTHSCVYPIQAH